MDLERDLDRDSSLHTRFNKCLRDLNPDLADRDLAALDLDLDFDLNVFLALPRLDLDLDFNLSVFSPVPSLFFLLTPP